MSAEWLTAVGTIATAVIALVAALFKGWQVIEIRRTRGDEARPHVIVDIEPSVVWNNILNLVVENIGRTAAHNVRLQFDPPLQSAKAGIDLARSVLITEGIATMPPGRRYTALFDVSHERHTTGLPTRYDVKVRFDDARGRCHGPDQLAIDLAPLFGVQNVRRYGIHDAAKALMEMQQQSNKWSDIHGRLRVWVRDEDAHRFDERVEEAITGRQPFMGGAALPELVLAPARNVVARSMVLLVDMRGSVWGSHSNALRRGVRTGPVGAVEDLDGLAP